MKEIQTKSVHALAEDLDDQPLSPLSQFIATFPDRGPAPDIHAVLRLKGRATVADLESTFKKLFEINPRFCNRLVYRNGDYYARRIPDFSLANVCQTHTLPGEDCETALDNLIGMLLTESPIKYGELPPWEAHLIHYTSDPDRTELLLRVNHTIGDGMTFMQSIHSIMTPVATEDGSGGSGEEAGGKVDRRAREPMTWSRRFQQIATSLDVLTGPILPGDPPTCLKMQDKDIRTTKIWAKLQVQLSDLREVAKQLPGNCSINDVAMSMLAGGARRYLTSRGESTPSILRLTTMVDTRAKLPGTTNTWKSGNEFAFIIVKVNTRNVDAVTRVVDIKTASARIRDSIAVPLCVMTPKVLRMCMPYRKVAPVILALGPLKASLSFSNVRGPSVRQVLAGFEVIEMYNGIDPGDLVASFCSFLTYTNHATFVLTTNACKVPDPAKFLDCMQQELVAMRTALHL